MILTMLCSALLGLAPLAPRTGLPGAKRPSPTSFDNSSILLRFDPAAPESSRDIALAAVGGRILRQYRTIPGLAHVGIAIPVEEAVGLLNDLPGILYAEPNYSVHLAAIPNDPQFSQLWGLHNTGQTVNQDPGLPDADIDAPEAWNIFTGDANLLIGVVDTGVNYFHPDLAANGWVNTDEINGNGIDDDDNGYIDDVRGYDFWNNDGHPIDDHGHGSFCAGVLGAVGNNGTGITGINWRCKIMPVKFFSASGEGTLDGAVGAIDYVVVNGAKLSNHSWIATYAQALEDAVTAARDAGHLMICATGNFGTDNDTTPYYPAAFPHDNIIAVGGLDNDDTMPGFANYGAVSVDLVAPAVEIYSCWNAGYEYGTGTSAAAPHVTGVAGLLFGRNPSWTYTQVRACILANVRRLPGLQGKVATSGVLNAASALRRSPRTAAP